MKKFHLAALSALLCNCISAIIHYIDTGWPRSYRKYILQITQPSKYRYAKLQCRFAVTSGSPSIYLLRDCNATKCTFHNEINGKTFLYMKKIHYVYKAKYQGVLLPRVLGRCYQGFTTLYNQEKSNCHVVPFIVSNSCTGGPRSYRKYILQITQPSQYRYAK